MKPYFLFPFLLILACGSPKAPEAAPEALGRIAVRTAPVERLENAEPVVLSGLLASETESRLSFKTGGVIQRIYVDEGQRVRKGQLLATLNLTEINAQVAQAEQALAKAARDRERAQNLFRDTVATLQQAQDAQTAYEVAEQSLAIARYNQGFSEIRAPHEGVILRKLMNEGEVVGPGSPLLFLSGTASSDWVLRAGVSDRDWARLRLGDPARVSLDAFPADTFAARVANLAQSLDPLSGLYQIELALRPQGKAFASGLFAHARIQPSQRQSLLRVPVEAIVEGEGAHAWVYVAEGEQAKRVPVRVAYIRGEEVYLSEGPAAGSQVIVAGSAYLGENSLIEIHP
jgi:RND family efflux transporter MFP subunit